MNNPCNECIVSPMCKEGCSELFDYLKFITRPKAMAIDGYVFPNSEIRQTVIKLFEKGVIT
jgi:hypothetical protein